MIQQRCRELNFKSSDYKNLYSPGVGRVGIIPVVSYYYKSNCAYYRQLQGKWVRHLSAALKLFVSVGYLRRV